MLSALVCIAALAAPSRHALLVGFADPVTQTDCALVKEALLRSGWQESEIDVDRGDVRPSIAGLFEPSRIADVDQLLVYVSGKGSYDAQWLIPNLAPYWGWDKFLAVMPKKPIIGLIADTGYTNLLAGRLPSNVTAITPEASWRDVRQARQVIKVVHNGKTMDCGIVTYILARELPFSTDFPDLAYRMNKTKDSASMGAIWAELPRVNVLGRLHFDIRP